MSQIALGFWILLVAVLLRVGTVVPALLSRRGGATLRLAVAGGIFLLFLAFVPVAARRVERRPSAAADQIWTLGILGLVLVNAMLWLL